MRDAVNTESAPTASKALLIMGVSGSGKSNISALLAEHLGWQYIEADLFHSPENIERMRSGIPLDDIHRSQWLDTLSTQMQNVQAQGVGFVLACSALKKAYRERLRAAVPDLKVVHLDAGREVVSLRMQKRIGHFMPTTLLDSQFQTLELPIREPNTLLVDASLSPEAIVATVAVWLKQPVQALQPLPDGRFSAAENDSAISVPDMPAEPIYEGAVAHWFDRVTDALMALLMAFMVAAVFANVVARYVFGTGIAGVEELSRLAFVWLVFVGVASCMRRGELMRFSMIRDRLGRTAQRLIDSLGWGLVVIASVLPAWGGWDQVRFGWGNVSTVIGYPVILAMVPIVACMLAMVVLALVQLVRIWQPAHAAGERSRS